MHVRRSLTIKQMSIVSALAIVIIGIFIVIQLLYFVQQRRDDYAQQLMTIAQSVKQPLSEAVLKVDIPEAERILNTLQPVGILSRADVVLPDEFQGLRLSFPPERPVPALIARVFELPIQVSLPLYALESVPVNAQPLAYLLLQADSYRMYQFIRSTFATMLITYLLLALILSVAISWCMSRLIVHPLRTIAKELQALPPDGTLFHQLSLSPGHQDDELGLLVRNYNRNQQILTQLHADMLGTRHPLSGLPNRALFTALLQWHIDSPLCPVGFHLLSIAVEPEQDSVPAQAWSQGIQRLQQVLTPGCLLAQIADRQFVLLAATVTQPGEALALAQRLRQEATEPNLAPATLRFCVGIARFTPPDPQGVRLLHEAEAALLVAQQSENDTIVVFGDIS